MITHFTGVNKGLTHTLTLHISIVVAVVAVITSSKHSFIQPPPHFCDASLIACVVRVPIRHRHRYMYGSIVVYLVRRPQASTTILIIVWPWKRQYRHGRKKSIFLWHRYISLYNNLRPEQQPREKKKSHVIFIVTYVSFVWPQHCCCAQEWQRNAFVHSAEAKYIRDELVYECTYIFVLYNARCFEGRVAQMNP